MLPTDGQVTVELDITGYGTDERGRYATADGWLWVDGRRIYHVSGLGMRVVPGDEASSRPRPHGDAGDGQQGPQ